MNKKTMMLTMCMVAVANVASAVVNVPSGVTGLWRFESLDNNTGRATMGATIGTDLSNSNVNNGGYLPDVSIQIGTESTPFLYQDGGTAQTRSHDWFTATHGISPNGGGSYVNEYTLLWDFRQTSGLTSWNSFLQTGTPVVDTGASDGDLFTNPTGQIGIGAVGYSAESYDVSNWNRVVLSVDNGNFFRVYVNGELFLDGAGQPVDGRFSLDPQVHIMIDNNWEDQWGNLGTFMTWDHALTTSQVAGMGGWEEDQSTATGNPFPTPLIMADPIPEPSSMILFGLGLTSLFAVRRRS
ncbi:PEP-CTERM sorting domain-containing protein [Bythopirellula goksoeyrii]|uniref:PEP-CTERM motif protein n=1 Tax=Bythopirellula goksoeyrii TaxID=1400387 RepID=A0A5B9Q9I9_9BACT|nr:PEP-CTERM sorting domain-containing protein [Bythopirellula goksoeyrii]QEG34245.1 PEP-CTERM motif protein [Bythopirellula goksoeyrii]